MAWVLLVVLSALFWQLGARGLAEPDEGRYASVAYEMVRSGDWLIPQFQGQLHLTKSPLAYWLMAASFKAFGFNEWAARLPGALSALGVLLLVWSLAWPRRRDAVIASALFLLICYGANLDLIHLHDGQMGKQSSARDMMRSLRQALEKEPGPVYFTKAPSAMEFYLQLKEPPRPLMFSPGPSQPDPDKFLEWLIQRAAGLEGARSYLVASSTLMKPALKNRNPPADWQVLHMGRKYAVIRISRQSSMDQAGVF